MRAEMAQSQRSVTAFLILLALCAAGCSDSGTGPEVPVTPPPPSGGGTVSFANQVLPILTRYGCTGCHGGSGGLTVTTVAQILAGGIHGPAVVAGNADNSILIKKLSTTPPFGDRMPQGGPYLPDTTVAVIKTWVNEGAKNN
jgi:hypothetical protein